MIDSIITGIIKFVVSAANTILAPIDTLIDQYLPQVNTMLDSITAFFTYISSYVSWALSAIGIDSTLIAIIVSYLVFKLTVPLLVNVVKTIIKWYYALKP